jgi:hypothetical protein
MESLADATLIYRNEPFPGICGEGPTEVSKRRGR